MITEKLPIDIKEKWIAALQSGDYKQTTGTLCDKNGYCCLGVLADICGVSEVDIVDEDILPKSWIDKYGIPEMVTGAGHENRAIVGHITEMNDDIDEEYENGVLVKTINKYSFTEIAEWIKINL